MSEGERGGRERKEQGSKQGREEEVIKIKTAQKSRFAISWHKCCTHVV